MRKEHTEENERGRTNIESERGAHRKMTKEKTEENNTETHRGV